MWYVTPEGFNEWDNSWYHYWIFTGISTMNIGQNIMMAKLLHIWGFVPWGTCWPNGWTCTWHRRWNFMWITFWHVDPKQTLFLISIYQCHDTRVNYRTSEENTGQSICSLTGCLWIDWVSILWCLCWRRWNIYWDLEYLMGNQMVWVVEDLVGHQMSRNLEVSSEDDLSQI